MIISRQASPASLLYVFAGYCQRALMDVWIRNDENDDGDAQWIRNGRNVWDAMCDTTLKQ
jgi:hypothetical protein